jgi:hypothetical protein
MHRRRVLRDRITYVGLDVHKEGIVVAVAEYGLPHFMPTTRVWFDLRATRNGVNLSRSGARGYRSVTASGVRTRSPDFTKGNRIA